MNRRLFAFVLLVILLFVGCGTVSAESNLLTKGIESLRKVIDTRKDTDPTANNGDASGGDVAGPAAAPAENAAPKAQEQYVEYPPDFYIDCRKCGGTGAVQCVLCDGEGETVLLEGWGGQMLPGGLYMPGMPQQKSRCNPCGGTGVTKCGVCNGNGMAYNKEYTQYVRCLTLLSAQTGLVEFKIDPAYGFENGYVTLSVCPNCKGKAIETCIACNGSGEQMAFVGDGSWNKKAVSCSVCFGVGTYACALCDGVGQFIYYPKP